MKLINQYKTLNADEKDLIHGIFGAIPLLIIFLWFVATANQTPEKTAEIEKREVKNYELPDSYTKYAERVYNQKYGK